MSVLHCLVACCGVPWPAAVAMLGTAFILCYVTGNSFLLGIVLFSMDEEALPAVGYFLCGPRSRPTRAQLAQCINPLSQSFVLGRGGRDHWQAASLGGRGLPCEY